MGKMLKFAVLVVVLLAAAYVAGFWPQRERVSALQAESASLQQRLDAAEAKVRSGVLLGELLTFKEVVQEMNYGQARGLSSPFFEHVAAEAARTTDASLKQALAAILAQRDAVTVALTQGDAAALGRLREAEARLRQALGYPAPSAGAAAAPLAPVSPAGANPYGAAPAPASPGVANPYAPPAATPSPLTFPTPVPSPLY
jgi:hypothetical protein